MTIVAGPHPSVLLTGQSISEPHFADLATRPEAEVLIDGPTGRAMTASGKILRRLLRAHA